MLRLVPTLGLVLIAAALVPAAWGAETPQTIQEQWELAGGPAVKIVVRRDGLYRVSRQRLLAAGLSRTATSRSLRLFTDGREVPIRVRRDRSIEFFGVRRYLPTTDARTYWLVTRDGVGKRFRKPAAGRKGKPLRAFDTTVQNRPRTVYFASLKEGPTDNFFGPRVTPGAPATQTLSVPAPAPGTRPTLSVGVYGISLVPHEVTVTLNGQHMGTGSFSNRVAHEVTARVPVGLVRPGDNSVSVNVGTGELDFVLLWRIRLTYSRQLEAIGDRLMLSVPRRRTTRITGFTTPNVRVLDITRVNDPRPLRVAVRRSGNGYAALVGASSKPRRLLAIGEPAVLEPAGVVAERPSALHRTDQGADFVIVAYRDFIPALGPLVQLRQSQGLSVKVVDVEDVYDEFQYGIHGVDALRRFFTRAYQSWRTRPRYVLLFGDGTYDPQNYLGNGLRDFVPSKTVDTPTTRVPSDDWMVDFDDNGVPELALGRLPVGSLAGAERVVAKVVSYDGQAPSPPRPALFVSDSDPRIGLESAADRLQQHIPASMPVARRYRRDSANKDEFRAALIEDLKTGPGIVDYVGHGGPEVWGREGLFFPGDADQLTNAGRLSVYVATSCLSAWFVDPARDSLGEALIERPNGGAVAVLSSSGLETLEEGERLNRGFLEAIFGEGNPTLGDAAVAAKRAAGGGELSKVMHFFGDPTARLR